MATTNVEHPVAEAFGITMTIPMKNLIFLRSGMNCHDAEEFFIWRRNEAKNKRSAIECDRARALVKYAESSGAILKSLRHVDDRLEATFEFYTLSELIDFNASVVSAVEGATMT